jgi:hypothetical protein
VKDPKAAENLEIFGAVTGRGTGGAGTLVVKNQDVLGDIHVRLECYAGIGNPNETTQDKPTYVVLLIPQITAALTVMLTDAIRGHLPVITEPS